MPPRENRPLKKPTKPPKNYPYITDVTEYKRHKHQYGMIIAQFGPAKGKARLRAELVAVSTEMRQLMLRHLQLKQEPNTPDNGQKRLDRGIKNYNSSITNAEERLIALRKEKETPKKEITGLEALLKVYRDNLARLEREKTNLQEAAIRAQKGELPSEEEKLFGKIRALRPRQAALQDLLSENS